MFVYSPEHIIGGLIMATIAGYLGWRYLHFRWLVWRGRKISEKHRADEADQLKKEMDALRPKYPNYSDQSLEQMVRANRLRTVMDSLKEAHRERNERVKGDVVGGGVDSSETIMRFSGGVDRPITVHSVTPGRPQFTDGSRFPLEEVAIASMINTQPCGEVEIENRPVTRETPQENEVRGKGNDTTTGNDSSARASGHRSDRDDSPGTKEGWVSERLQGGSGWGSSAVDRSSSRDDSDSRSYDSESGGGSSPTND